MSDNSPKDRLCANDHLLTDPRTTLLKGVNVLVMTSGHYATDHRVYNKLSRSLKNMAANVVVVGMMDQNVPMDVKAIGLPKASSRLKRFLLQPWRCLWAARNSYADIVHFHDAEMLATLPVMKICWSSRKFVYDVHEDFGNLMLIRDWIPSGLRKIVHAFVEAVEKKMALLADGIVAVTPPLMSKFRNENKIAAYNFITREFFEDAKFTAKSPQERHFDLVHLGTLNMRRARFLVDTITELHKLRPESTFLNIGASSEINRELRIQLPKNCSIVEKMPHHDISGLLGNAKIGLDIHPWSDPHLDVALPVKVCEYMASECAVVSSSMPVLDRLLEKSATVLKGIKLIDGDNPVDFARAIVEMIKAIEDGETPGGELRKFALKNLHWDSEADKIAALYLKLLGKKCVV